MQKNKAYHKITLIFFFISQIIYSQKLHHQTIASAGGAGINSLQVVGQQSVIGLGKYTSLSVQQGYINSLLFYKLKSKNYAKKNEKKPHVFTYPNPFNTSLEISFESSLNGIWEISILDLTGKIIYKKESIIIQSTIKIDNFYYPDGYYFLLVSNDCSLYKFKILKKS